MTDEFLIGNPSTAMAVKRLIKENQELKAELERLRSALEDMLPQSIVAIVQQEYAADYNRMAEMLADRTDELIRLKRLVGEET